MITKVHVGCGPKAHIEGWWNTDLRPFPGIDQAMDATEPWPWRDQLTHVFAEHFLEHLQIEQAFAFLGNAGRALRDGGRLRLSTPNLTWVVAKGYECEDSPEGRLDMTLAMNRAFHGWGHQFLWTEEMLTGVLASMGYADVETFAYGESRDPELNGIERHGGWGISAGHPNAVIVEAVRGARPIEPDPAIAAWVDHEFARHVNYGH